METYIATFFSHFGSVQFKREASASGWEARIMPVPRNLSSSCGTCVQFETEAQYDGTANSLCPTSELPEELEQIVKVKESGYQLLYKAEDS